MSSVPFIERHRPAAPALTGAVRWLAARPVLLLGTLVTASFAFRFAGAWRHVTPRYFPDEYIYSSLARSISNGSLEIRGEAANFPALLEPLLSSVAWLAGDVDTAFRITQGIHCAAVSLAVLPVYWLARRVGLPVWSGIACAMFAVALPGLLYAGYLTADATAYPLALGALAAGVAALDRPSARTQLVFLALAGAATLARVQYVVIVIAFFAGAAWLSGLSPRRFLSGFRVSIVATGVPVIALLAAGPSRALGYYAGVLDLGFSARGIARWAGTDLMLLTYVSGVVLVPCAVVGLVAAIARPRSRVERSFGAMAAATVVLLLVEAAVYASNGAERFQGRYLLAVPPLVPIAFFLGVRRLGNVRALIAACSIAAGFLVVTMRVPLSGYTALNGEQDSPFLQAVAWLDGHASVASSSLGISAAAGILSVLATVAAVRPRFGAPASAALALLVVGMCSVAATATDADASDRARRTFGAGTEQRWIDRFGERDVAALVTVGADRSAVHHHLFWNQSVTSVLRLPGSPEIDAFGFSPASVSRRGVILERGRPVRRPLLVQEYYTVASLADAELLQRTPTASLWKPHGVARLESLTVGRYLDSWIDRVTTITLYPRAQGAREGVLRFSLSLPAGAGWSALTVTAPGFSRAVVVTPKRPARVSVPFNAVTGPVEVRLRATKAFVAGLRVVAAQMSLPEIVATPQRSSGTRALPIHTA